MTPERTGSIIALLGTTASGKSTFATRLGEALGAQVFDETGEGNPFIKDAHNPEGRIFQNQIWFLLQSVQRWKDAEKIADEGKNVILDTFPPKNIIHSKLLLDPESFTLYEQLACTMTMSLRQPSVVVYLYDSADFILERLKKRNKAYDSDVLKKYINDMMSLHDFWIERAPMPVVRLKSRDLEQTEQERKAIETIAHLIS